MLRIENLLIEVRNVKVEVQELDLDRGDYLILLGPSGVGKTLLLYTIVGIIKPKRGRILVDNRDVTDLPPERRGIALVPQNFALFPHKTVFENIAFGLKVRKVPEQEIRRKVLEIAEMLNIKHILDRKPSQISVGEAQRVALARALVIEPKVLLLDEPFANLDPDTKVRAMELVRALHRSTRFTAVHVTHDIFEAICLGTRLVYMYEGRIVYHGDVESFLHTQYARPYLNLVSTLVRKVHIDVVKTRT